jgi:hypothetical protein
MNSLTEPQFAGNATRCSCERLSGSRHFANQAFPAKTGSQSECDELLLITRDLCRLSFKVDLAGSQADQVDNLVYGTAFPDSLLGIYCSCSHALWMTSGIISKPERAMTRRTRASRYSRMHA